MKKTGFTLIELLIVVAIIAILAAIAVPNFLRAQVRAKIARSLADMRSLGAAIEAFRVDYNLTLVDSWDFSYPQQKADFEAVGLGFHVPSTTSLRYMSIVYNVLTTPVAYTATLPHDPFITTTSSASTAAMPQPTAACSTT